LLPTSLAALAALEAASPGRLTYDLEEVRWPAVGLQVRFTRFVVVRVLYIAGGAATVPPWVDLGTMTPEARVDEVLLGDPTAVLGLEAPVERQAVPVPAVPAWALLARQPLPSILDRIQWRGKKR
jgi:hypothetical protein